MWLCRRKSGVSFKMTIVYDNSCLVGYGICKDVLTPLCLDKRLPLDTLYMVFEEDYRFFPLGKDPDGCDDYCKRVANVLEHHISVATRGSGSQPPQSKRGASMSGESSGKEASQSRRAAFFQHLREALRIWGMWSTRGSAATWPTWCDGLLWRTDTEWGTWSGWAGAPVKSRASFRKAAT